MVEVFKTNVEEETHAKKLITVLLQRFPDKTINFDLDDCDRILRIEGLSISINEVENLLNKSGFFCEVLD